MIPKEFKLRGETTLPGQRARLVILIIYVAGLLLLSKIALGTWLPPLAEKGVWFYSALAALLLGNLLITPYFTKPADAVSNAVAAVIALLAVNVWVSSRFAGIDRFLWSLSLIYAVAVLVLAVFSIVCKDSPNTLCQQLAESSFLLGDRLGNPRAIFSVVFLFALVTYHRQSAREYLTLGIAWALFVGLRPLESVLDFVRRLRRIWATTRAISRIGEIVGHETPNIILIREERDRHAKTGKLMIARSDHGIPCLAIALDHVGYSEGRWLRALHLCGIPTDKEPDACAEVAHHIAHGDVFDTPQECDEIASRNPIWQRRDRLLGLVAPDSTVSRLTIEVTRDDVDLHQGALIEADIGSRPVLYQIIDGMTKEEIVHQKNTRGFVRAEAKKIGTWNDSRGTFDVVPWLPRPNQPVFLAERTKASVSREAVGHFPGTPYPVSMNVDPLVTHNAAILGILGVGKSFLAIELVERMIDAGIKVICLDLTNQYAKELSPYYDDANEKARTEQLQQIGLQGKKSVSKNVEEGGSIRQFATKTKEQLAEFLAPACQDRLRIYNPAMFEVWRQDSKPFQNEASMAMLTPTEITRIITESALAVLQEQGMTDKARSCLVYEEAHSLVPEWNAVASDGDKAATNGTAKAILQGRKFGLGCLVITQRTANVTKSILNQCNTIFALRVFDATGMEFLKNYIGDDYAGVLCNLEDRHAVIFGRGSSCHDPVLIRLNDRDKFLKVFRKTEPQTQQETSN